MYNARINNEFYLTLKGEACIPQVAILEPFVDENNKSIITFPLTYVGETQSQTIRIQNVGKIICQVIMDISKNRDEFFTLETCQDSIKYLNLEEPGMYVHRIMIISSLKCFNCLNSLM